MTDAEFSARLGAEIKALREQAGLTQTELAARAAIHRNSVCRYECGEDIPAIVFVRVCVAMQAAPGMVLQRVMDGG
ncbi:MAG: helix-turn-helix transcriptional regulator [Terracidiphilus sp.]